MAKFITPVSKTREEVSRFKGDYRFANFDVIPSLPSSGPAQKSKKHVGTYFNNKQIFRTISEWFEVWMPWQRRIVLCGTTDRCSTSQLEYLATALEPVFHRDFQTSLRGSYPSLNSRKGVQMEKSVKEKSVKKTDPRIHISESKRELRLLNTFALHLVNNVISDAVHEAAGSSPVVTFDEETHDDSHESKKGSKRKPSTVVEVQENSIELISNVSRTLSPTTPRSEQSRTSSSSRDSLLKIPKSERTSFSGTKHSTTSSQKDGLLLIERKSVDTSSFINPFKSSTHPLESSFAAKPSERRKAKNRSQAYNHYFCGQEDTGLVDESQLDALPPLEAKKVSTFNWCMSHRVTPSAGSSTDAGSANSRRSKPHRHTKSYPLPGSAATTEDFFDRSKIQKLGAMKGVLRTGQINKPPHVQDLFIPVQKTFKPSKLWTPRPVVVPAKKQQLRAAFKDQLEQIWTWLKEWEDHEKGDLLVELIKMCDQELIKFFASCLTKRLHQYVNWLEDRMDINSLPDSVLLHIFYMLAPNDLLQVELVCKRWRFLVSQEELWRFNCRLLGARHGSSDLVQLIEYYMSENAVDWREAYWQLTDIMVHHSEVHLVAPKPDTKRVWRMMTERLAELRRRYLHDDETESESSESLVISESDQSIQSDVVEVAIAVACPRPSSAHTETSSEFGLDHPDMGSNGQHTPPLARRRKRTVSNRRRSTKLEDIALDIRPELHRSKNLLNPSSEDEDHIHYDGKIKQIKRVRRLQGHIDTICCVRFDIRRLITGSMDRTIRVWDIRSGKGIRKLTGHKGGIRCLQFDETRLVSGSWDMSVIVWDVVRFEVLAELTGHTGVVSCLQFNDQLLVTGSHDNTLRVWSMINYECKHIIRHHSDAITCVVLESDVVISGSLDRTLKVTDVNTGECLQTMAHEKQDRITTIQCLFDQILVGTLTGRFLIWNRPQGTLVGAYQALDSTIYKLAILSIDYRETKILIASADGSIGEWVLESMTCVRILQGHRGPVRDIQVSDSRVVSCSEDKTARIWDLSPPPLKPGDQDDSINPEIVNERDSD